MGLIHLIYSSAATDSDMSDDVLNNILDESRENNKKNDISGILLFQDGCFFQVLEGDKSIVGQVYESIEQDERHTNVTKIIAEPISFRSFGDWTMGYPTIKKEELNKMEGLNDFFSEGRTFLNLGGGRAKQLLENFKEGRWRR